MTGTRTDINVRAYRDEDEPRVLELLAASLGGGPAGGRPAEFFRWKHVENPFGRSFMLVAEEGDRIVGLRAFMRWRFSCDGRSVEAVRAVDTATHPDHQGRGIFSRLTREALELMRGQIDLVFNTPNEKSLPGYLKMGWGIVGTVPISLRIRRPLRFARGVGSIRAGSPGEASTLDVDAPTVAETLAGVPGLPALLRRSERTHGRLATSRDAGFLDWRYGRAPRLGYHALVEGGGDDPVGLAIFRVRTRGTLLETTVAEVIVGPGDTHIARRLLRRVVRSASVDHLTAHLARGSTAARASSSVGFVRSKRGMVLVVNPLRDALRPDPSVLSSWSLALGDLEVF